MSKPSYRKITGDEKMSTAKVVTDEQLEGSIQDVSKVKEELDEILEDTNEVVEDTNEVVDPPVAFDIMDGPDVSLETKETLRKIGDGAYSVPEYLLTSVLLSQKEQPVQKSKRPSKAHIVALRQRDRYFNKTCAACGERKLLKFMDGGKADICDTCRK